MSSAWSRCSLRSVTQFEPVLAAEPDDSVPAVLAFCNEYVALIHEPAREVHVRNLLVRLRASSTTLLRDVIWTC